MKLTECIGFFCNDRKIIDLTQQSAGRAAKTKQIAITDREFGLFAGSMKQQME